MFNIQLGQRIINVYCLICQTSAHHHHNAGSAAVAASTGAATSAVGDSKSGKGALKVAGNVGEEATVPEGDEAREPEAPPSLCWSVSGPFLMGVPVE